jgi:iron complex outermembrane receptor protein
LSIASIAAHLNDQMSVPFISDLRLLPAALLAAAAAPACAQVRTADNAVTQAEDAFGFSIGRESVGIYSSTNTRGFSPLAAGNVRLDGLYFDPELGFTEVISDSSSIKVGLSAQGYPFAAPSGIVDYRLARPQPRGGLSLQATGDSFGSYGFEADGALPLAPGLVAGVGITGSHTEFGDGTSNWGHDETLLLDWRPTKGIEIVPFWEVANDYDDLASPIYVPAGPFLPPAPPQRHFFGPPWARTRWTGTNQGVLASAGLGGTWLIRLGLFRSVMDFRSSYANLFLDEQPDGNGEHVVAADPPRTGQSMSGELRLTHSIADGERLHLIHLSLRGRDARREFGGSTSVDLGSGRLDQIIRPPQPDFAFGPLSRDRVRQLTLGIAYDGRWKNVGEFGLSLARADYRKTTALPGAPLAISASRPWLYDATLALDVTRRLVVYAGYARGLEESGLAPASAVNRNQPLPAIITDQKDAGFRFLLAPKLRAVGGLFILRRPSFGLDGTGRYVQIGTTQSRGAEFSLSGDLTPRLSLLAGAVFLSPRVTADRGAVGVIGTRPTGLPASFVNVNLNWRSSLVKGLELDVAVYRRGTVFATTDDKVALPPWTKVDVGAHYRFRLARHPATVRVQLRNIFDNGGLSYAGPGAYGINAGRYLFGSIAFDI